VSATFDVAAKAPRSGRRSGKVRRRLADLDHRPRRSLGQNFLADPGIAKKIVDLAAIPPGAHVVEIGPGLGALTQMLAERAAKLSLIEYDAKLAADLRRRFADQADVEVIEADALEVDFASVVGAQGGAIVVANLPYNIATAVIARLLERRELFSRLVVMVQREVAERLRAAPGSKAYGRLSVLTQIVARAQRTFVVRPAAFVPRPQVDSAVVLIEPAGELRADVRDFDRFRRLVMTVFGQRRKQLANSLRSMTADPTELLRAAGIDPKRRPETLSLEELARLSNALGEERES
jgi:16S rRNA (adenine1518-N6/adenine1519-N6)-dimethyltransferase